VSARSDFGCDLIEVKLGSTRAAPRSPVLQTPSVCHLILIKSRRGRFVNPYKSATQRIGISRIIHWSRPAGVKQLTAA
jgi:hypothetical protein